MIENASLRYHADDVLINSLQYASGKAFKEQQYGSLFSFLEP